MSFLGDVGASLGSLATDLLGSAVNRKQDYATQKKLLQNSIQWRVSDAKAAGIHPLYALGAQPVSFMSSGFSGSAGQDMSRAIAAGMSSRERQAALIAESKLVAAREQREAEAHAVAMDRAVIENKLLSSRLARFNSAQLGPGAPVPDVKPGDARVVTPEVSAPSRNNPSRVAGIVPEYQYSRSGNEIAIVPSPDISNRFDEIPGAGIGWWYRNNIIPHFDRTARPPPPDRREFPLPDTHRWAWNGFGWLAVRRGRETSWERRDRTGYAGPVPFQRRRIRGRR